MEWNETFRTRRDPFAPKIFSNLSPEILVEWIAPSDAIVLEKLRFQKMFSSTRKRKVGLLNFLRFKERFRKAPFSWRFSVEGTPNRRKKALFSNSSGAVETGLYWLLDILAGYKNFEVFLDGITEY